MTDWVLNFPTLDIATLRAVHKSIDAAYKTFSRNYGDAIESAFDPLLWLLIKFEWVLLNAPWWVIVLAIAGICYGASRRMRPSSPSPSASPSASPCRAPTACRGS